MTALDMAILTMRIERDAERDEWIQRDARITAERDAAIKKISDLIVAGGNVAAERDRLQACVVELEDERDAKGATTVSERCSKCNSPKPYLHPAMQFEGEVQVCKDPWHSPAAQAGGEKDSDCQHEWEDVIVYGNIHRRRCKKCPQVLGDWVPTKTRPCTDPTCDCVGLAAALRGEPKLEVKS